MQSLGRDIVDCYCCYNKGKDDINHILLTGNFANYIWKKHASSVGAVHVNTNTRSQLLYWRNLQTNNEVHNYLFILYLTLFVGIYGKIGVLSNMEGSNLAYTEFKMVFSKIQCRLLNWSILTYHGSIVGAI